MSTPTPECKSLSSSYLNINLLFLPTVLIKIIFDYYYNPEKIILIASNDQTEALLSLSVNDIKADSKHVIWKSHRTKVSLRLNQNDYYDNYYRDSYYLMENDKKLIWFSQRRNTEDFKQTLNVESLNLIDFLGLADNLITTSKPKKEQDENEIVKFRHLNLIVTNKNFLYVKLIGSRSHEILCISHCINSTDDDSCSLCYNILNNTWSNESLGYNIDCRAVSCSVDLHTGMVYIFGGVRSFRSCYSIRKYDPFTRKIHLLDTVVDIVRFEPTIIYISKWRCFVISGGRDPFNHHQHKSIEIFVPSTHEIRVIPESIWCLPFYLRDHVLYLSNDGDKIILITKSNRRTVQIDGENNSVYLNSPGYFCDISHYPTLDTLRVM
jgi:hypothetical protein